MRFQVPQFVMIEDKIFGPLTLRQFLIFIAVAILLVPVYLLSDLSLFLTIAVPVIGVGALFAFFRLHGKSLFALIVAALGFVSRGQVFLWQRGAGARGLPVKGPEYSEEMEGVGSGEAVPSLQQRQRQLDTEGKIIADDLADPFGGEEVSRLTPAR